MPVLMIDGSAGEGGGQIVRTALSLSMITGTPFRIDKVRAKRAKPGLLRQHLTSLLAAEKISGGRASGVVLGASSFTFEPGPLRGGTYDFAVGSAGSTMLVFQTVLPALLKADAPSDVMFSGGTHNPAAPTFDYIAKVFLPVLAGMGAQVNVTLQRRGFYPAGGGKWQAHIVPVATLRPVIISETGKLKAKSVTAVVANLPYDVATREIERALQLLGWPPEYGVAHSVAADGHGNIVAVQLDYEHISEVVTGFGAPGISAEEVATRAAHEVRDYQRDGAPVGRHLADQLLIPMALSGGGSLVTSTPTEHTATNMAVIEKFLPITFVTEKLDSHRWRISLLPRAGLQIDGS